MSVSPKSGMPVARILVAMLLASAATGCSSDASRFSAVFSTDNLTTASIPRRNIGGSPVPYANVGGMSATSQPDYTNRQQALSQPYPRQPAYTPSSAARAAAAPVAVQRAELAAPAGSSASAERAAALAQPFPSAPAQRQAAVLAAPTASDGLTTGATQASSGWGKGNAARVTLRPGETIATLSKRYGVPEKEILKANGLTHASDAASGQLVLIPSYTNQANAARAAADASVLPNGGKKPSLPSGPEQKVAVLPTAPSPRDKSITGASSATGKAVAGAGEGLAPGGYVVKPGDSLTKIAKVTGTPIDKLKAANGLTSANIRIGQTLKIPAGGASSQIASAAPAAATDPLKTATIPAGKADAKGNAPAVYKAPATTQSVGEVASVDPKEAAPEATGIGKYRWPVRGAVVAGYGANVDGKRNDGIDISVPEGTPVKAAENGVVIYAGNGLKELGNTVLVRHDDGTVTVYGHADALSVQRGQKVQRGQQLATSGMSGNVKRPMLHFEVRKDATPVNPITYLE